MDRSRRYALVAEDDAEMRALVSRTLRREGFEVVEVADGPSLRSQLELAGSTFSIVVSDVRMPGGSGLDILEGFHLYAPDAPIVLTTAFGDDEIRARARLLGAILLDKPFALDALRVAARAATSVVCA